MELLSKLKSNIYPSNKLASSMIKSIAHLPADFMINMKIFNAGAGGVQHREELA